MTVRAVIVSCEHATSRVPARWAAHFAGAGRALASHRGSDIGAAWLARGLARRLTRHLAAPVFLGGATRLLIDLNRSLSHRAVFSEYTRGLSAAERLRIVTDHYAPYRSAVEAAVRAALARGERVLHLSVHSFAPRLGGHTRRADVGLLYDPARAWERALCAAWKRRIQALAPWARVRRNYPYRGTSDGLSVALRRLFDARRYACVEVEVNQRHLRAPGSRRDALADALAVAVAE